MVKQQNDGVIIALPQPYLRKNGSKTKNNQDYYKP